jgi:hypothetical protein
VDFRSHRLQRLPQLVAAHQCAADLKCHQHSII